jgi:hypothetical protein
MSKSKKRKTTKKETSVLSELKKSVEMDIASIKDHHKGEFAALKKGLVASTKKAREDAAKLRKSVAAHKKKSTADIAKLRKQLADHKKKLAAEKKVVTTKIGATRKKIAAKKKARAKKSSRKKLTR